MRNVGSTENKERQQKQIKSWLMQEKEKAENSENWQVREYVKKFAINEERSDVEKMKKWIMNLKKLKMKVEKVPKNDIRNYILFENV